MKRLIIVMLAIVFLNTIILSADVPVWAPEDKWYYEMKITVEGEKMDGEWLVENATSEIIKVEENWYVVRVYGNLTGNITLHVDSSQQTDKKPLDLIAAVTGKYNAINYVRKSDLATINSSILINGTIASVKILPFYIKIHINYEPPYSTLNFPLEVGKEWEVTTNVSAKGEIYVKEWADPPKEIDKWNITTERFKCIEKKKIKVKAGEFEAYHVVNEGIDIWYAEEVTNVIKSSAKQISIKNYTFNVEMELKGFDIKLPPSIEIIKPRSGYLYLFDREIMELGNNKTIIIGKITVETSVQNESMMDRVDFYFNEELCYSDNSMPYEWVCRKHHIGNAEIKCIAYDVYGKYGEDEMSILFIHP